MSVRTKYRVVTGDSPEYFQTNINELAEQGYGLAFYQANPDQPINSEFRYTGVMKLKDEQVKLEEAEDVINVDITAQDGGEIKRRLGEGWVIIAAFSKQVTMMKPKTKEAEA
jgi:hypothetical protein